jgi:hypothetical protein
VILNHTPDPRTLGNVSPDPDDMHFLNDSSCYDSSGSASIEPESIRSFHDRGSTSTFST